ncbi:class I SAM-dependent DNA methyltransferase [Rhodococcus zopfii]|uniref:class I SAM-dependent DNA methyltransferase n=1 Tax=Rhodococcus zopfii TaxID=43772 RepID=UPI003659477A
MSTTDSRNLLTDNPALYEARFPDPDHVAARFVDDIVRTYLPARVNSPERHRNSILDLGCGTGRDLGYLADRGYRCVGLDRSEAMVSYARLHHRSAAFAVDDLREFSLGAYFDAIICLDSSLLYCHTDLELESCLSSCRHHLRDGGLLVAEMRNGAFFLGNTELLDHPTCSSFSWQGDTWQAETTLWIDHAAQLLRRRRRWSVSGESDDLLQTSAWRLLFPVELTSHLRRAGFRVKAIFDTPGPRAEGGWPTPTHPAELPGLLGGASLTGDRLHVVAEAI